MIDLPRAIINTLGFQPKRQRYFCCPTMLVDCEEFAIEVSDDTLNAWYFTVKEPRGYVVASYGAGNCVCDWVGEANYLREQYNVSVLVHDYRGYGKSTGSPDIWSIVNDSKKVVEWLCEHEQINATDLIMYGYSLGGAIAVHLASEFQTQGLIVSSSFTCLGDLAFKYAWFLPGSNLLIPWDYLNSRNAIAGYYGTLLCSHGDHDDVIPPWHGRALFDACPSEAKTFVAMNKGHTWARVDHHEGKKNYYYQGKEKEFFASMRKPVKK